MTIDLATYRHRKALWERLAIKLATFAQCERFNDYLESEIMSEGKRLFSTKEAAELLLLHPETVRRFVREGQIKAVKLGRKLHFERGELEAYWRSQGGGKLFADSPDEGASDE